MMSGTGRVAVGESAASKKYRMTLAGDSKKQPPPNNRGQDAFVIKLPDPPLPPRPCMARPIPPPKSREWEDHGWMWRLRHHMHLYSHRHAERKAERAEQEREDYKLNLGRYRADQERCSREEAVYREELKNYKNLTAVPPPPTAVPLEELTDYERAAVAMRKQIQVAGERRIKQFNYVMETSSLCSESYNEAVKLLVLPGKEAAAALRAMDYISATKELNRAKNKYIALVGQESSMVNKLEMAADVQFKREIRENESVIDEKIADDLEEIRTLKEEIGTRALPDSVLEEADQANKDLATVLAEMQEKIKNETRRDLDLDMPQVNPAQKQAMGPLLL